MHEMQPLEVELGAALLRRGWMIGTAESCTGGLIGHRLTEISGSSAYVRGGIIAYSNEIKQAILGVSGQTLMDHGAVSEPVAAAMAQGARRVLDVDLAVSVTGIAGPGGGTVSKPVGLTYIGAAGPDGLLIVRRFVWAGDRSQNKQLSADAALRLALDIVQGNVEN